MSKVNSNAIFLQVISDYIRLQPEWIRSPTGV